jgi:hypothetical protein
MDALVGAEVLTVRVAVWLPAPVIVTGEVAPKLRVGGLTAPAGEEASDADKVTAPVNPAIGLRVIVDVFPVVEPGAMNKFVPLRLIPGGIAADTETYSSLLLGA